jgi:hypothetical protein
MESSAHAFDKVDSAKARMSFYSTFGSGDVNI